MLTPALLDALRSDEGHALLREAELIADDPFAASRLRVSADPALAAAAVDQVRLRRRAAGKFVHAERMWFERSLLEQASGSVIAAYRAGRFGDGLVADLCCGLGGDALELARRGPVVAMDRDPLARALTEANAAALGVAAVLTVRAGELPQDAPEARLAWMDPGRREQGKRTRSLDAMSPPFRTVLNLRQKYEGLAVKLAPGTDHAELDLRLAGIGHSRAFISVNGECRELVVGFGALAGAHPRCAVLLPGEHVLAGRPLPLPPAAAPGEYLLEPDGAVLRAGLVGNLAGDLGAWSLDPSLSYLSLDTLVQSPFARTYRIDETCPFSLRVLTEVLRQREAGDVVLKTRGVAMEPEELRQRLRAVLKQGKPDSRPVVFITRIDHRPVMLLGEFVAPGSE